MDRALTIDSDILFQIEVLDSMTKSLDIELSFKVPHEGLGVEHVAGELCESSGIGDSEAALQVQITTSTTMRCNGENQGHRTRDDGSATLT